MIPLLRLFGEKIQMGNDYSDNIDKESAKNFTPSTSDDATFSFILYTVFATAVTIVRL